MSKINGYDYPLFDKPAEQEKVYNYFLAKDLELLLKDLKADEPGTTEPELEEVE